MHGFLFEGIPTTEILSFLLLFTFCLLCSSSIFLLAHEVGSVFNVNLRLKTKIKQTA